MRDAKNHNSGQRLALSTAIRGMVACSILCCCCLSVRAADLPGPPLYHPIPAQTALDNLVDWKVEWLTANIASRKTTINSKKQALAQPNLDDSEKKTIQDEIDKLAKENDRDQDEINSLKAPKAFDPKVAGSNVNVKILTDNIKAAVDLFHGMAVREIKEARDEKNTKETKEKAEAASKEHADSETHLDHDLTKAKDENPEVFKKN
jgi:hypothetical protein